MTSSGDGICGINENVWTVDAKCCMQVTSLAPEGTSCITTDTGQKKFYEQWENVISSGMKEDLYHTNA